MAEPFHALYSDVPVNRTCVKLKSVMEAEHGYTGPPVNRTCVELKSRRADLLPASQSPVNRTCVELKLKAGLTGVRGALFR